jgi:hypothetical protein
MKLSSGFLFAVCVLIGLVLPVYADNSFGLGFVDDRTLEDRIGFAPMLFVRGSGLPTSAVVVWDNGGFVTHPGAGFEGADISMASEDYNSAGGNVRQWEENEYFRIADSFQIESLSGLVQLSTFGYEPFLASPAWTSVDLRIWRGFPDDPESDILFQRTYDTLDVEFTGAYRILHLDDLADVRRPVFEIRWSLRQEVDLTPLWLEPGQYWIDWKVVGGETGWALYAMEANEEDIDQPLTLPGSAHQLRPVGWTALTVASSFRVFALPNDIFRDRFEAAEQSALLAER